MARIQEGRLRIGDREITRTAPSDPAEIRRLGVAHVPEDRHRRGLVLPFDARENAILGYQHSDVVGDRPLLSLSTIQRHCETLMERFDVRPRAPRLRAAGFPAETSKSSSSAERSNARRASC